MRTCYSVWCGDGGDTVVEVTVVVVVGEWFEEWCVESEGEVWRRVVVWLVVGGCSQYVWGGVVGGLSGLAAIAGGGYGDKPKRQGSTYTSYLNQLDTTYRPFHSEQRIDFYNINGQYLKELRENTFSGSEHEDAMNTKKVLEIVDLFHIPEVTQDQVMLRVFPFHETSTGHPAHTAKKMEEINNFQQEPDESLFRAWERFKELLMKCPQHYLTDMQEVILFYNESRLEVPPEKSLTPKGSFH
ncbi:hypothetical protein Tco_0703948 [Tanacetum coccineum]|uniref:Retrotransposon gag domain-containing protein n=1 Tax=Tanacetum coccineum TaxID=301880 RepID=A0ABQ4Y1Q5_9ASTR